ncbi:MAG: tetratricopeptide repeat protein [Deltaproteobacteria bacterium]|nr:tetratricopeptide repeat protein [Deltaproteobacteria bacterium]
MKSWSASRWILLLLLTVPTPAGAGSVEDGYTCLERLDIPCAVAASKRALVETPGDPRALVLAAQVAFHQGRTVEAARRLDAAAAAMDTVPRGLEDLVALYRNTAEATAEFEERIRNGVCIRWAPGPDAILLEEAFGVLSSARARLRPIFGELPPDPVLVEIYPSGRRFRLATGFGLEPDEGGGVVGLSRWARILLVSPRSVARGYAWKDSLVHEYVHQIVSWVSTDRAPVWLQEGIARYLERCWRQVPDASLSPYEQSLVALALGQDDLVTFEEIHPSIAFLPTTERKALAYAQVKILVATAVGRGGEAVLRSTLQAVRSGGDAAEALASAAGYASFEALFEDSLVALRAMDLVQRRLEAPQVVFEGEGDEYATDPLLARRRDLAEAARLGALLLEAGRPRAALVEYARAHPSDEPPSPLVAAGIARCRHGLGDPAGALAVLRGSVADYPEFADTWKAIADLERASGHVAEALAACRAAADVDPFDPQVQDCIADLGRKLGHYELADAAARARRILVGGADPGSNE